MSLFKHISQLFFGLKSGNTIRFCFCRKHAWVARIIWLLQSFSIQLLGFKVSGLRCTNTTVILIADVGVLQQVNAINISGGAQFVVSKQCTSKYILYGKFFLYRNLRLFEWKITFLICFVMKIIINCWKIASIFKFTQIIDYENATLLNEIKF